MVKLQVRRRRRTKSPRERRAPGTLRKVLGWCVHAYTALGLVAAGMIAVLLVHGGPADFRWSFLLMLAATVVDATDGTLARKVRIKEAVPSFDGRRLDDIIDFLTYTFLPLGLIWRAGLLPAGYEAWLFLPLLASIYGFCQVQAKTDDGYFLGFPSLWNVVAVYLYALPFGQWASLAIVIALAILTFVPSRYLYPSLPGQVQPVRLDPRHPVHDLARLDHLQAARRHRFPPRPDDPENRLGLAELSHPLPRGLVVHQRGLLDEAQAGRGIRGLRR